MPGNLDHSKSILPYKDILESYEESYRDATVDERPDVIEQISNEIKEAAGDKGAKIPDEGALHKKITHFYINHRSSSKDGEGPPVRVGKQWNTRLVVGHLFHDQIEEEVKKLGNLSPAERIAKWAFALSAIMKDLSADDLHKYSELANNWKAKGPPIEVQRREAQEKTGKTVMSFLDHLKKNLGVHAVVFVAYQDEEENVKISDFESGRVQEAYQFGSCNPKGLKEFRSEWGTWAKNAFVGDTLKDGGGEAAEPVVAKVLTAEGRFLQLDSEGFLELQPLPDQGTVLRVDLAKAMHSYVSQKWKLKGGGKRVKWKEIMADNEWYIDEKFLLKTRKFYNPTRLSENSLRAYWTLWYDLENSDQPLTFKQVGLKPNQLESDGRSSEAEGKGEEQEISDNGEKQADEGEIPKSCKSEKEKLLFLRSLLPQHQRDFHSIINAVAPMEESDEGVATRFEAGCFSWEWDTPHSDLSLHLPNSTNLTALLGWLGNNPHLTKSGTLVNRETLLRICLGLGLLVKDATLIQFTEGDHAEKTPGYIVQSSWGTSELDAFNDYLKNISRDMGTSLTREKKRKASVGDPAPAQQKAKKATAKFQPAEGGSDEEMLEETVTTKKAPKKPKTKAAAKVQPRSAVESEGSDKGEGPSNPTQVRKSSRLRRPIEKGRAGDKGKMKQKEGNNDGGQQEGGRK